MESVLVEKRRIHTHAASALEETAGRDKPAAAGDPYYYVATLVLRHAESGEEWVDVRLNGRRLATVRLIGPFTSGEPTLRLRERTEAGVRGVLEPLKQRTKWK